CPADSLWANRISLKPQGFNITFFWKYLATGEVFPKENITLTIVSISLNKQKEREDSLKYTNLLFSVALWVWATAQVHLCIQMRCRFLTETGVFTNFPIRTTLFSLRLFIFKIPSGRRSFRR
ncbi:MAG: hypothetical protein IKL89_04925, partial [Clostridia bacterium]|nr:hypothetical protein [Clostridia bacterium]